MGTSGRPLSGSEIRRSFLDFFAERGHIVVPSAPLVPAGDPTLLFTNSGMVQFKDVFLGTGTRSYTRAVDSQKCMRVAGKHNDLDDVGRDDIHHTFFEMLGNWSFGDYYKREAIGWAWDLLTREWGLAPETMWATCFEDEQGLIPRDDEAADLWRQQPGFDPEHILFFGRKDNFWEMAELGPCGPDSEIHVDRGPGFCTKQDVPGHVCKVNDDCGRFVELWNLVFIQYNRTGPTELSLLPQKHVDTGMGFERLVSVLQDVESTYKTDLLSPLMDRIQTLGGHSDEERAALLTPYRVVCDHSRAAAFLIADGVVPGNTGRNYVCRMIIRRASRFGAKAGFAEPFLAEIADAAIEVYSEAYPELARNRPTILQTITEEERRFQHTVDIGLSRLMEALDEVSRAGEKILPGSTSFELYATYGLPLEITRDVARELDLDVDEVGFAEAMENHRLASSNMQGVGDQSEEDVSVQQGILRELQSGGKLPPTGVEYDPYGGLETEGEVLAIISDAQPAPQAQTGDRVEVVLPATHFYLEAGGQVSDTGTIVSVREPRWEIEVEDMRQPIDGLILHVGHVATGSPRVGDRAIAAVDASRRMDIMRNHTATHLLHASLQRVLGAHARQAGSLVAPDRLRFDFNHPHAVTADELRRVEDLVNDAILHNYDLEIRDKAREDAIAEGAMALFGENYGETVRTISIGDARRFSYELCGGTHVAETGIIGPFLIVSESSVAAGIRRIEAVTGRGALALIRQRFDTLERIASSLGASLEDAADRTDSLVAEARQLERQMGQARQKLAEATFDTLRPHDIHGVPVMTGQLPDADADSLRHLIDRFRQDHPSGVVVLASAENGNAVIVAAVSADLVARGLHAGELVKSVAVDVGGSGGGKPTLAQAGGKDPSRLPQALQRVPEWVASHLV
jgi:alanyl-tRNA synthetase